MDKIWPPVPDDAKQTNCWRLATIILTLTYFITIIESFVSGDGGKIFLSIFNCILAFIYMYHTQYVKFNVTNDNINITMGPCNDTCCTNSVCNFISWIFSNQLQKDEVKRISRHTRQLFMDECPRFYCFPIYWCLCDKSYSAYYWPFCCEIHALGLCIGDSDTKEMLIINLTEDDTDYFSMCCKHWTLNILSCFVYNRIAIAIKDDSWYENLRSNGYKLLEVAPTSTGATSTGATSGNDNANASVNNNNDNGQNKPAIVSATVSPPNEGVPTQA